MKIYQLELESFKPWYKGLWTSLEKAAQEMVHCPKFREVVRWNVIKHKEVDGLSYYDDYDHNRDLVPRIEIAEDKRSFKVIIENYKFNMRQIIHKPEVKEAGKPYVPASTETIDKGCVFETIVVPQCGYIYERDVDAMQNEGY